MNGKYYHSSGAANGITASTIEIINDIVIIMLKYNWIGSEYNATYKLEGKYIQISKPYGIIKINKFTNIDKKISYDQEAYFDTYIFGFDVKTEWNTPCLPIKLSTYNGCHSLSKYHFQIVYNTTIVDTAGKEFKDVIKLIDGLKYEKSS